MNQNLDQLKLQIREHVLKFKKTVLPQCTPEEIKSFETWYWKLVPLIQVDLTLYNKSIRVYETTPPDEMIKVTGA